MEAGKQKVKYILTVGERDEVGHLLVVVWECFLEA